MLLVKLHVENINCCTLNSPKHYLTLYRWRKSGAEELQVQLQTREIRGSVLTRRKSAFPKIDPKINSVRFLRCHRGKQHRRIFLANRR